MKLIYVFLLAIASAGTLFAIRSRLYDFGDFLCYWYALTPSVISCEVLEKIPVCDNQEPLVSVQQEAPDLVCQYVLTDMIPYVGKTMFVRKSVASKLMDASRFLQEILPQAKLKIAYGYRKPAIQKKYFESVYARLRKLFLLPYVLDGWNITWPWLDRCIRNWAHLFAAYPLVAGHPTGGAVDITIEQLDMGGTVDDFMSGMCVLPTYSPTITSIQRKNREVLRTVMLKAGFAPFDGEWWHFSYGDKEWAAIYQQPYALYDQINLPSLTI
jgi:zinc D-Ala-D-Ala dipeptidase